MLDIKQMLTVYKYLQKSLRKVHLHENSNPTILSRSLDFWMSYNPWIFGPNQNVDNYDYLFNFYLQWLHNIMGSHILSLHFVLRQRELWKHPEPETPWNLDFPEDLDEKKSPLLFVDVWIYIPGLGTSLSPLLEFQIKPERKPPDCQSTFVIELCTE